MEWNDLDKNKLRLLLLYGLSPIERVSFFRTNQTRLIAAGAKAQNLPNRRDSKSQVEHIVNLPLKARVIFENWLKEILSGDEIIPVEIVVETLESLENGNKKESTVITHIYRSAIAHLLCEPCPELLFAFLKRNERKKQYGNKHLSEVDSSGTAPEAYLKPEDLNDGILTAIKYIALGQPEKIDILNIHNDELRQFLFGMAEISRKSLDSVASSLDAATSRSIYKSLLSSALEEISRHNVRQSNATSLILRRPIERTSIDEIDISEVKVFGICESVLPSRAIIRVIGILEGETIAWLSDQNRRKVFYDNGEIIVFPDTGLTLPTKGELGVWKVENFPTQKPIKFRVVKNVCNVYEFQDIPYKSTDTEEVRQWLQNYRSPGRIKPLFRLNDGKLIRPIHEISDYTHSQFEEPFNLWLSLSATEWNGRQITFDPLPKPDGKYDCSDLTSSIKKVIKFGMDKQKLSEIAKQEINALSKLIHEDFDENIAFRIARIKPLIQNFNFNVKNVDSVIQELMNLPNVQERIQNQIQASKEEFEKTQNTLKLEIEALIKQKEVLSSQLEKKKSEKRELSASISRSVRASFERAKQQELETLGNFALYEALLSTSTQAGSGLYYEELDYYNDKVNLDTLLSNLGIRKSLLRSWSIVMSVAIQLGQSLTFKGSLARIAAIECARYFCRRRIAIIYIPIGLVDNGVLRRLMGDNQDWDTIILEGANLSAFEAYGSYVYGTLSERIMNKSIGNKYPCILMTLSEGISVAPTSALFSQLGPIFDTDRPDASSSEISNYSFDELITKAQENSRRQNKHSTLWIMSLRACLKSIERQSETEDLRVLIPTVYDVLIEPYLNSTDIF